MNRDPRGGHNQKKFDENFFKTWSHPMAYVFGLITADGVLIDARKSSRTCYISLSLRDEALVMQVKNTMHSQHTIYIVPEKWCTIRGKQYFCKKLYKIRFGSKRMFQDLVNLGITPRKSLTITLPSIPTNYFGSFLRGYLDGDGCIYISKKVDGVLSSLQVTFTSGNAKFLQELSLRISELVGINRNNVCNGHHAYQLRYKKKASIQILKYMYKNMDKTPFLYRKYELARQFL